MSSSSSSTPSLISATTFTHESLNFLLPAQQRACFYDDINDLNLPTRSIEVFIHSSGDTQIDLEVYGPLEFNDLVNEKFEDSLQSSAVTANKEKVTDTQTYITEFTASETGSYAFCLDNRKNHFFPKLLEISITTSTKKTSGAPVLMPQDNLSELTKEIDPQQIQESVRALAKIQKGIFNLQLQQQRDRHRLNLHSAINQNNYSRVFNGSIVETAVFILVSLFQVYFVRRWFANKMPRKK